MNLSILITAVDEWDRILNYTFNNSRGLPTLTLLVTMVNVIQENLVFDDITVYFIQILSFWSWFRKDLCPKFFSRSGGSVVSVSDS